MEMVYVDDTNENPKCICPKKWESVNVTQCPVYRDCYDVLEYPVGIYGHAQSMLKSRFRPLSDALAEISIAELVEEVVEC